MVCAAGVHVTLPDYYSPEHLGMIVPKTKDGRVVFMLPWLEATIAGTTGVPSLVPRSSAARTSPLFPLDIAAAKWCCIVLSWVVKC